MMRFQRERAYNHPEIQSHDYQAASKNRLYVSDLVLQDSSAFRGYNEYF